MTHGPERPCLEDDRGTTLPEVLVAMLILSVFMGIFTTTTLMVTRTTTKIQAVGDAVAQTNGAFLTMERTLRYATGISTPEITSGKWNVEFSSGQDRCTQLRVDGNQMQQRSWKQGTTPSSTWTSLASNLTNGSAAEGSADAPFSLVAGGDQASRAAQSLRIRIVSAAGATADQTTSRSSAVYTALNSNAQSSTPPCQGVLP